MGRSHIGPSPPGVTNASKLGMRATTMWTEDEHPLRTFALPPGVDPPVPDYRHYLSVDDLVEENGDLRRELIELRKIMRATAAMTVAVLDGLPAGDEPSVQRQQGHRRGVGQVHIGEDDLRHRPRQVDVPGPN